MGLSDWSVRSGHLIADALAVLEGISTPPNAWLAFACQAQREDAGGASVGGQNNNPLNLTTGNGAIVWPGQTGTYGGGDATEWHGDFAAFGSLEAGCWACADNYHYGSGYAPVRSAFHNGDPVLIAQAIEASPWDSGHYTDPSGDVHNHTDLDAEVRALSGAATGTLEEMTDEEFKAAYLRVIAPDLEAEIQQRARDSVSEALKEAAAKLAQ